MFCRSVSIDLKCRPISLGFRQQDRRCPPGMMLSASMQPSATPPTPTRRRQRRHSFTWSFSSASPSSRVLYCVVLLFIATCASSYSPSPLIETAKARRVVDRAQALALSSDSTEIEARRTEDFNSLTYFPPDIPSSLMGQREIDHVSDLVQRRSEARFVGDYAAADAIRDEIEALAAIAVSPTEDSVRGVVLERRDLAFPPGYKVLVKDRPRKDGGGSSWELVPLNPEPLERPRREGESTVLQLAHAALGLASAASEQNTEVDAVMLDRLVSKAMDRIRLTGASELRGRKAADAAFWFALSGVGVHTSIDSTPLFDELTMIATDELRRFGMRSSCRPKDVLHIVERIAAAGIKGKSAENLYAVAAGFLSSKGGTKYHDVISSLRDGTFKLHSDRPLLSLWRFSTKQRKQNVFLNQAAKHWRQQYCEETDQTQEPPPTVTEQCVSGERTYDWNKMFKDPHRPLCVDIGCGMGVSLLGLASLNEIEHGSKREYNLCGDVFSECNFVGVDLSRLAIGYARGLSRRWGLDGRLQFCVDSAEQFLGEVARSYPGDIKLVMIQFPTPFRLQTPQGSCESANQVSKSITAQKKIRGNSQLAMSSVDGFMVSKELISSAYEVLVRGGGSLLLQSNCEDVAVWMKNLCTEGSAFECVDAERSVDVLDGRGGRIPRRTSDWISMGGERAEGREWSSASYLPRRGATETEVSCLLSSTPVHRCLLKPASRPLADPK